MASQQRAWQRRTAFDSGVRKRERHVVGRYVSAAYRGFKDPPYDLLGSRDRRILAGEQQVVPFGVDRHVERGFDRR